MLVDPAGQRYEDSYPTKYPTECRALSHGRKSEAIAPALVTFNRCSSRPMKTSRLGFLPLLFDSSMKTLIAFLAVTIGTGAHAGEKKMVGSDVDYVATAISDMHATSWQVRSTYFAGDTGLFGATTTEVGDRKWQEFASKCLEGIKSTLNLDGWTVTYDMGSKPITEGNSPIRMDSFQIMMIARRGQQDLQLLVAVFPFVDGKVNVAYTQTRK